MAFIGEVALSALFDAFFTKLFSSQFEFVTEGQVRTEVMKWVDTLKNINAVLADAEGKQMQDAAVKTWLADLQDLAYDVDDILDEFATEALGRKLMKDHHTSLSTESKLTCFTVLRPVSSIHFNNKLMSKLKEITRRLEGLAARKSNLQLREIASDVGRCMSMTTPRRTPSTSLVNEADVHGRDKDKKAILDLLSRNDGSDAEVYSVIPIVGMGGIGKTTLAQLVYNDDSIKDHFELRAWVCVSDDFDIARITKTILWSLNSEPYDMNDLNSLQVKLKEKLSGKKFLLILDDVWNEKYTDWEKLRSPFSVGESGSKIIVTTRSSIVSSIMKRRSSKVADYSLQCLSKEDSLCMLAHDALETEDFTGHPNLKDIGLEIVKKCDGLPLAIKTISGLLRTRVNRNAWKDILESDIWNLPPEKSDINPALWLSYYYLPPQLKQCFAYCSLIPKDFEFKEKKIVLLWMAEGFLSGANSKKEIENLGSNYFQELVSRSFFQASGEDESKFVMHDLINDLAQFVGGEKYFKRERDEEMKSPSQTRHSSYVMVEYDENKMLETFFEAKSLRTFLPFQMRPRVGYLSKNVLNGIPARLKCLRVLSLKRYDISEIPYSIGNLRHLRYLDFSYTKIKCLPDSICTLYNLETILLKCCRKIEKLPLKIGILENLCHLDISGAYRITEMPSEIGKLTNLQALSNFIVGQGDALNIKEMQNLSNLKGQLAISELQNVNDVQDAWEAKLSSKPNLHSLEMKWSEDFSENLRKKEVETEVLNLLQPHEELKVLAISYYAGIAFPNWLEDPSFKNLQSLKLVNCRNCPFLPIVGKLPLLKDLYIKGMNSVTSVGNEFYGENLETLHFEDMPEWVDWKACEVDDQARKFHSLQDLRIVACPKFIGSLPKYLPLLEKLYIRNCQKLEVSISNLPKLCELEIEGCKKVVVGSCIDLWSIKIITLSNISKFACVTKEMMTLESIKVEDLCVSGCEELASLWQTEWGWLLPLKSPRNLVLENCPQVVSIGGTKEEEETKLLHNFMCLAELKIVNWPKLVSLSADNLPSTVRRLEIWECENLLSLLEDGENIYFNGTFLLESLYIANCNALKSLSSSTKLLMELKTLVIYNCENLLCLLEDGKNINFSGTSLLESLEIGNCNALKSLSSSSKLFMELKMLVIYNCENLLCLLEDGENINFGNTSLLESLEIRNCKALRSLSSSNMLPRGLKKLKIYSCPEIEFVAQKSGDNICIESIEIWDCKNIRYLSLGKVVRTLYLDGSEKLEALPSLYSLQELTIWDCPRVTSIPDGGLPTTLTILRISGPNIIKAVMEWGLHTLKSLRTLVIKGSADVLFPPEEIKLPSSLNRIRISDFKRLTKLSSKGFQYLSSLQSLLIVNCPKLKSLPKKEMLSSLLELFIENCPELKKRCKRDKGKYWSYISDIPSVTIDRNHL